MLLVYRQKTIAILDLEKPNGPQPLRKLGRQNKFDVRVLEWNHNEENRNLLASTVRNIIDHMHSFINAMKFIHYGNRYLWK